MGSRSVFADAFMFDVFGVVTGSVSCVQFPTGSCNLLRFKADPDNIGQFHLGDSLGCLYPLDAGDEIDWFPTDDLNRYYHSNPSGTTDYLYWWLMK